MPFEGVPDREKKSTLVALMTILAMGLTTVPPQTRVVDKRPVTPLTLEVFLDLMCTLQMGVHHVF